MSKNNSSQIHVLAHKFASQGKDDERAFAMEIFGCPENDQTYIRVRSQLKRLLLSRLFHLDIRTGSLLRKAIYRNAKEVFCIRVLVFFNARSFAMWLIPPALERARKFELTSDRIELLLQLRQNATINGDKSDFAKYSYELEEAEQFRTAEMKMHAMDEAINVELVGKAEVSDRARNLANESRPKAARLFEECPTFNIGLDYFRIATLAAEASNDYADNVRLCQQAEQFLSGFPHLINPSIHGQFAVKRLTSALAIHDWESFASALKICETRFTPGGNNWYVWKEYEFLQLLHSNQLREAETLHQSIAASDRFASQPEQVRQKWMLFGHYAELASWTLDQSVPLIRRKTFERIARELPIYKRDKAGYDAALLILQQLLFASSGNLDGMIQKSDSLKRYISRYLKNRRDTQLYAFLKMLILLQKCDFDIAQAERRGEEYVAQFSRYGREIVDEKQTLPYDLMWRWIADWTKQHAPKYQKSTPKKPAPAKPEGLPWRQVVT
ncbi:MAG TPA: hypothetical protein VFH95_09545, partial [Candidatus Kapabacteria bacterium]|nr:hypothetical protein [Candidatus Kapabacteria bacterium]